MPGTPCVGVRQYALYALPQWAGLKLLTHICVVENVVRVPTIKAYFLRWKLFNVQAYEVLDDLVVVETDNAEQSCGLRVRVAASPDVGVLL